MGFMPGPDGVVRSMNVHGAGAQRSDPKSGDPKSPMWVQGRGPQGGEVRIYNYARAVRGIDPASVRLVPPDVTPLPPPLPPLPPPRRGGLSARRARGVRADSGWATIGVTPLAWSAQGAPNAKSP
jgi:hypothetical protein